MKSQLLHLRVRDPFEIALFSNFCIFISPDLLLFLQRNKTLSLSPSDTMEQAILHERMFVAGEEPSGDRVNTYHKLKRIESILDALEPEEVHFLQQTMFGKIISLADNPSFSGRFGQFVIVRILHVKKVQDLVSLL